MALATQGEWVKLTATSMLTNNGLKTQVGFPNGAVKEKKNGAVHISDGGTDHKHISF